MSRTTSRSSGSDRGRAGALGPPSSRAKRKGRQLCVTLSDESWDAGGDTYGRAAGDRNTYSTGRIGCHNVELLLLPRMGKVQAASAAASLRSSYTELRLALLAGICGGVPQIGKQEVLLGNVIISNDLIQYDLGRQYPDRFVQKDTVRDTLSGPSRDIRGLLAVFQAEYGREHLRQRTVVFLKQLQTNALHKQRRAEYGYPGIDQDKLFEPSYRHKHHFSPTCVCRDCQGRLDPVCDEALDKSCINLACDERYLVLRERAVVQRQGEGSNDIAQQPMIHIGSVASGDKVMKSGEDRDALAAKKGIIAFEMEGAGVWEEIPCIIVKGVCDYADSHKNKKISQQQQPPQGFVGREAALRQLDERLPPDSNKDDCQRTAIEGLGGIGKTQIALEAAFRCRNDYPDCSVFWVPAIDATTFENAYRQIGQCFNIAGVNDDKADVKALVKAVLSRKITGKWLLIIDNLDDTDIFFGETNLSGHLPLSKTGSILFTTRNHQATARLDIPERGIFRVTEMSQPEAIGLLQIRLKETQMEDMEESAANLAEFLQYLPLALKQASAYMAMTGMTTKTYLKHCQSSDQVLIKLLSKDFEDRGRYKEIANPVATTWLISFKHISRTPLAARYLSYMSFFVEKAIPKSLLPPPPPSNDELQVDEAIGVLKAYAFIAQRGEQDLFDIHRLVHLAIRNWLLEDGKQQELEAEKMQRLNLELLTKVLGREYPDTLVDMHNLASTLNDLGCYDEPFQMHWQEWKASEKVSARRHPHTLISMNSVAIVLKNLGRYDEAEDMHRQALESKAQMLS